MKTVLIIIVALALLALLLYLARDWIAEGVRSLMRWRIRRKERELADVRLRLEEAYLACASNLNGSAHEARKAMIMEAVRLSKETCEQAESRL